MSGSISMGLYASVLPSVIAAGGSNFALNGLILTTNTRVPLGTVPSFPSAAAVSAYFGPGAAETAYATIYFGGFLNSSLKPGALLFSQYPWTSPVAAYLRGGNVSGISLATLQSYTGTIALTVNGTLYTSSSINLSSATSFSNAATLIQAAFTSPPFGVTYDSVSGGFVFTSSTTGNTSTITFPTTGAMATNLLLTAAGGAVLSQGSAIYAPAGAMAQVVSQTTNWFSYMTTFEPVLADKTAFAAFAANPSNPYLYVMWEAAGAAALITSSATGTAPQVIVTAGYAGTEPVYLDPNVAAFEMGSIASVNYGALNGVATQAFKQPAAGAITPSVTSLTAAVNLASYGVNYYGITSQSGNSFQFTYPGTVTGQYKFVDAYANEVWFTNQLQIAMMTLLTTAKSVPYNTMGYTLIEAALAGPINAAVFNGVISPGVLLSPLQVAEVNAAAGLPIDTVLGTRGWYLQVLPATAQVRAARGSPPISLWYMYAGSVQTLSLNSVLVQ